MNRNPNRMYEATRSLVALVALVVVLPAALVAVADAVENTKALQMEGSSVVVRDIAGARFVSRYDARIVERARLAA